MTDPINLACEMCGSPAGDQCRTVKGRAKAFCKARGAKPVATAAPPEGKLYPGYFTGAPKPDDFDESTPKERRRPEGRPVGADVVLAPGEDPEALFAEWDRAGRVPAGSLLCRFLGERGYELLACGAGVNVARPKAALSAADLAAYRITSWIACLPSPVRRFVVFSPRKES